MTNTITKITYNDKETFTKYYTEDIKHFFPKGKSNKYYALMTFKLGRELNENMRQKIGDPLPFEYDAETWYTYKINYFIDGIKALNRYSESTDVAQLVATDSKKELAENMANSYINMNDESWRIKNLYPYI